MRLSPEYYFLSPRVVPLRRLPVLSTFLLSLSRCTSTTTLNCSSQPVTMDDTIKQHYLADSPPTVVKLEVKHHFDNLQDEKLRKYAHFISR